MEAANDSNIKATLSLKNYVHVYAAIHEYWIPDEDNTVTADMITIVLTQHHVSKGLKLYGEKEWKQC